MKKNITTLVILLFITAFAGPGSTALPLQDQTLTADGHTVQLKVPEGMAVEFVAPLASPRFPALGPGNEMLIGSSTSSVYRFKWPYREPETLVTLPGRNHSVAYREGRIYIAETGGLSAASYAGPQSNPRPGDFSLVTPLPSQTGGHWSRTVITGPDNRLFIGLGISGNCPDEYLDNSYPFERRRGGVFVLDESTAPPELVPYASGLRNPIGLAFHPQSGILYATNAGPDNLGFYLPPEVFTPLHKGSFHGMPWFQYYDGRFRSGECAASPPPRPADEAVVPPALFKARSTPQGVAFVTNNVLGNAFENNALVAIHGSWAVPPGGNNASRRPPKIVMVHFQNGAPTGEVSDIITGFQRPDGSRFARPSGVIMGPDGYLYFTSDRGDVTGLFRFKPADAPSVKSLANTGPNLLLLGNTP